METILAVMSETPLFGGLTRQQLEEIEQITVEKAYDRGQPIFWEGDEGTGFFIVISGSVKIYKVSPEGKEQILHIYGPGQPIGEVPVFTGDHFPANAQAVVKSRLLFFPRQNFVDLITAQPSIAPEYAGRIEHAVAPVHGAGGKPVSQGGTGTAGRLSDLFEQGTGSRFPHPPAGLKRTPGQLAGHHPRNPVANIQ